MRTHEQFISYSREIVRNELRTPIEQLVILDLDGVILRWPQFHIPDHNEQSVFFSSLADLYKKGTYVSVLTNRPPGHMQPVAYNLGINTGAWVTESGGSLYLPGHHKSVVIPSWNEYASIHVPQMRDALETRLGITGRTIACQSIEEGCFEPGMGQVKTCICPPAGISPKQFAHDAIRVTLEETGLSHLFTINSGKAVDIDPMGLSKKRGMQILLEALNIDPHNIPTLFIADEQRDIEAGSLLLERGGFVGAVGNAAQSWKQTVGKSESKGFIAPDDSSYFSSVTHILAQFLKTVYE